DIAAQPAFLHFSPFASFTSSRPFASVSSMRRGRRLDPRWQRRTKYLRAMAATNKCLARINKSRAGAKRPRKRRSPTGVRRACGLAALRNVGPGTMGSNEQIFGAKQQVPHAGETTKKRRSPTVVQRDGRLT